MSAAAAAVAVPSGAGAGVPSGVGERIGAQTATGEAYWEGVRREFKIADGLIYLNTGTLGPVPRSVVDTRIEYLRRLAEDPRVRVDVESVRAKAAAFVGADADEIVLTRSTTEGLKLFCSGLDIQSGDEVLMTTQEHDGGQAPWRVRAERHGVLIREVDIPLPVESVDHVVSLFERAITPKTRVLLVSHPVFTTGLLVPIKELAEMAHRKGLLISVDGAHALGMLHLDLHGWGVDHYSSAGHKWLMAGSGTGLTYIRREIQPRVLADMPTRERAQGARKYEQSGTRDVAGVMGMGAAFDFHQAIGQARVEARVRELAAHLRQGLAEIPGVTVVTPQTPLLSGGLTTFSFDRMSSEATRKQLLEKENIYITGSRVNDNACRVSTHVFTQRSEIDRLLGALRRMT